MRRLVLTTLFLVLSACASTPAPSETPWEAECNVDVGDARMKIYGIAGLTDKSTRPIQVVVAPQLLEQGNDMVLDFVMRHEFFHAIGWHGHPHAGPDGIVVLMDKAHPPRADLYLGGEKELSDLELRFLRAQRATIYVTADARLAYAVARACSWLNRRAGREVFHLRVNPATMK